MQVPTGSLRVPDRFEGLRDAGSGALRAIIAPVYESLKSLDRRFVDMRAAGRGSFIVLRGETGAGKSTFLDTVGLFRVGVVTERIPSDADIPDALRQIEPATEPRLLVLEGREALGEVSREQLEAGMHAINSFVRSDAGKDTVIVWPANTDDLAQLLAEIAQSIGAEALLGVDESVEWFSGPPQTEFVGIAERTVAALNEGASLAALGISAEHAHELVAQAATIGRYLALIRSALIENEARVRGLLPREQYRVWTLVIAGNDPEGDVAALTRGGYAQADIDRLMTATGANVVAELKKHPEQLGILGSVLDARILQMDMLTSARGRPRVRLRDAPCSDASQQHVGRAGCLGRRTPHSKRARPDSFWCIARDPQTWQQAGRRHTNRLQGARVDCSHERRPLQRSHRSRPAVPWPDRFVRDGARPRNGTRLQ